MTSVGCPNRACPLARAGSIIRHGFYNTNSGKRRRYRCRTYAKTFCSNARTPCHRLQHHRATFDEVARLSVEGLNKSAIARVKRIAWNTVALKGQRTFVLGSMLERLLHFRLRSFRLTRFGRSSAARNTRSGSSPQLMSGLSFGLRPS